MSDVTARPVLVVGATGRQGGSVLRHLIEWRNESIIPGYNKAGVRKFAFIAGPSYPGATVERGAHPAPEGPANFPTGWFSTRDWRLFVARQLIANPAPAVQR